MPNFDPHQYAKPIDFNPHDLGAKVVDENQSIAEPEQETDGMFKSLANKSKKSLLELNPELKNPKKLGKGALQAGGLALSMAQPEIGALRALAPNLPKLANALLRMGAQSGYGAIGAPDNPELGALVGGAGSGISQLAAAQNPLVGLLGRAGVGAGIGEMTGHPMYGAVAGALAPNALKLMGMGGENAIASDALEGLTYKDVAKAKKANDLLNTPITPAQASGNYVTSAKEGSYKRTPEAGQIAFRQEEMQKIQQGKAIDKMLNDIYTPSPKNEKAINDLYAKAEKMNLPQGEIDAIKADPIMKSAFDSVKRNPAFKDVPENNYKFLAQVDRTLYRQQKGFKVTDPNTAYEIGQAKNAFNKYLKDKNSDYLAATKAAQPKLVRENIEEKLNKHEEDYTGKNFYSKFLSSRKSYRELLKDTKNFPQAQQSIKAMREGWKHLSNIKPVSQGEAQAKSAIDESRNIFKEMIQQMYQLAGAQKNVKSLKFIYSKDWDNKFNDVMKIKDQRIRNIELINLLAKVGSSIGLNMGEEENSPRK